MKNVDVTTVVYDNIDGILVILNLALPPPFWYIFQRNLPLATNNPLYTCLTFTKVKHQGACILNTVLDWKVLLPHIIKKWDISNPFQISKAVFRCPESICNKTSTPYEVVHIEATNILNESDSIHYLYSCINRPTIVLTHVFTKTELQPIQWEKLLNRSSGAITFSPPVTRISGFVLSKVFSYNDTVDQVDLNGHFKDGTRTQIFGDVLDEFVWSLQDDAVSDRATFVAKSGKKNGSMSFQVSYDFIWNEVIWLVFNHANALWSRACKRLIAHMFEAIVWLCSSSRLSIL